METTASTINQRILELVEDMGGPSEVARKMGVNPQIFYNLKNRPDSKPNSESLERFFAVAPRANANYIYKGIGPKWLDVGADVGSDTLVTPVLADVTLHAPLPPDGDAGFWRAKCIELENKLANVEGQLLSMTAQIAQVLEMNDFLKKLVRKLDPTSFNGSDSHITAFPSTRRLISMGRHDSPVTDCKVLQHPAMWQRQDLRLLNSLMPVAQQG